MQTVKRLVICLTCIFVLLSSFPYVSAAEASENDNVFYEYDENGEVIGEYYTYHEDYDFQNYYGAPENFYDPERGPMMYAASKSNYSWRPSSIDWSAFPSYIRAIAYSPYSNISWLDSSGSFPDQSSYRAPFIMITSNGTNYTVRAGWDVALWYRESTGNTTIAFNKTSFEKLDPVLYMGTFKCSDNSVVTAWHEVSYATWGTSGQFHNFPGSGIGVSENFDVFTYGANAFITNNGVLANVKLTDTEYVSCAPYNKGRGILDHGYKGFPATFYNSTSSLYFSTFTPGAPNDYTVSGSTSFGITSKMITNDAFIFHENLPYGLNSLVFGFTKNSNNTYHVITDSTADVVFLRNWNWSDNSKFQYTVLSSAPIYRIAYSSTSGGYASMSSASGLTVSDYSSNFSDGSTSWHSIVKYYIDKGYHAYWYSIEGNNEITISNNSTRLKVDDSLSFSHSYGSFPTADTLSQFLMNEQNSKLDEQNSKLDEQNSKLDEGNETSKSIWQTLKDMFEKLKNLPSDIASSIKSFFTNLGDRISGFFTELKDKVVSLITGEENSVSAFFKSLKDKLSSVITGLGDRISGFFTTLSNNIKGFFTGLGDRISDFFINLSNNISGYFDTLRNYILYFQATKPEHVNPFEDIDAYIENFFQMRFSELTEFKNSMNTTFDNVVYYIHFGSSVSGIFLSNSPIVYSFFAFFVVFFVVRKVVGR